MSTLQTLPPGKALMNARTGQHLFCAFQEKKRQQSLYLQYTAQLEAASLHVIAYAFRFAAAQEQEHADILQGLLSSSGKETAAPPSEDHAPLTPLELLREAARAEHASWSERYPAFARIALEEGYHRISTVFLRMAETDRVHALRFTQYLSAMADGTLLRDTARISWVCLSCGQLHTGCEPPPHCPGCSRSRDHFIRSSFYPFAVEG